MIFAHAPEMLDGDRSRELIYAITGTMTAGTLAVDGFFLISGYLITASFASDPRGYMRKRILRIYPAFLMCSALCAFALAPAVGGVIAAGDVPRLLYRAALLKSPEVGGAFEGLPIAALNGSMWTIAYEFRCYLLAALLGLLGLYSRPMALAAFTAALLAANLLFLIPGASEASRATPGVIQALFGEPQDTVRLTAIFFAGACFRWLAVRYTRRGVIIAAAAFVPLALVPVVCEIAVATAGGYLLFALAFHYRARWFRTLNAKDDISYGLYLYAWPITNLVIWNWPGVPLPVLILLTLAGAAACGALSWFLLERPAMRLKSLRRPRPATAT